MYPLHEDMILDAAAIDRVRDYLRETGFGFPGTGAQDYDILPKARYLGWHFAKEDLEAYAVGLSCTKPGYEGAHTFIRMSREQLLGAHHPTQLELNEPVLATDALRMRRWRGDAGRPRRTGPESYATADGSAPGVDLDLCLLSDTLGDIVRFAQEGHESSSDGQWDLAIDFGTLLAGRYPRLKAFEKAGRLRADQRERLGDFESRWAELTDTLKLLKLPTIEDVHRPEKRRYPQHHS